MVLKKLTLFGEEVKITPLVLLVIFVIVFRIPNLFEPYWYGDEAIYLTVGEGIRQNLVLYKDIFDHKTPLIYIFAALAGSLFWFKFMLLVWSVITLILFWKLATILFAGREKPIILSSIIFALLTTLPFLEGNIVNSEILMMGPVIAGLILILGEKRDFKRIFSAGVLFSLAVLIKVPAIFDFGAVVFYLLFIIERKKEFFKTIISLIYLSIGFLVPITISFFYFFLRGALPQYLQTAWFANFVYISLWHGPQAGSVSTPILSRITKVDLLTRGGILAAISAAIFIFRSKFNKNNLFISLWFAFSIFAALISGRPYPHYLMQIVPAFSLVIAVIVFEREKQRFLPIPLIIVLSAAMVFFKFTYYPVFAYYKNFLGLVSKRETKQEYFNYFDKKTDATYKIAQILTDRIAPTDRVFIWGTAPEIYALSRRLPPGRYITSFHIKDFHGENETIQALEKNLPKYIIVLTNEERPFPDFFSFLREHYIPLETIGNAEVWKMLDEQVIKALNF